MRKDATDTVVSEGSVNRAVLGLSGWYLSLIPKDKKASCTTVCVLWVAGVGGEGSGTGQLQAESMARTKFLSSNELAMFERQKGG